MAKRFVFIWFRYLQTDRHSLRQPALRHHPIVLATPDHGRLVITATNAIAEAQGIGKGMTVADARAVVPSIQVLEDDPDRIDKLLKSLAGWCIRFTPQTAIDPPDGLVLDASGCAHLWKGEQSYIEDIGSRLSRHGYQVNIAMADTISTARAIARFGSASTIVPSGQQAKALLGLPPAALRLEMGTVERLQKLGLHQVGQLVNIPRPALRRRFGQQLLTSIDQALGLAEEAFHPIETVEPYLERLPCLEPIATITGIEMALQHLLHLLCTRLRQEQKGLRQAIFKGYRIDGNMQEVSISTSRPSCNGAHLFRLFATRLDSIEPDLGIELFTLQATAIEDSSPVQEKIWDSSGGLEQTGLAELIDNMANRIGAKCIHRYLPNEHYWPERCIKPASSLSEKPAIAWPLERPRPIQLLSSPEPIQVMALLPDYPPMNFRYKGKLHTIKKSDGPERIEREWWLEEGLQRDYYCVEDEQGQRYWLFRSGHYDTNTYKWFIHGFFA